jgi:DNA invertase Pin-like site-specific DNA recombinase
MAYYKYKRVSTKSQTEKYGLEVQEETVEKYCAENNIELCGEYMDGGISGATDDMDDELTRPGLNELLSVLQKGDKIIVLNTSRLWRNDTSKVIIRRELMKSGADVISVEQPTYSIYSKDPNDFLINSILEILDMYDKMLIVRKLYNGRRVKAIKAGTKACGSAPIGYKWSDRDIEVDVANSEIVIDIFVSFLRLHSLTRLSEYCKKKGYKTLHGNDFSKQALRHILTNDFYAGVSTFGGVKSKGTQPVFISIDLFNEVQKIMGKDIIQK